MLIVLLIAIRRTTDALDSSHCSKYIWAEFGASNGSGMEWIKNQFDVEAVGIDIDMRKVLKCRENGKMCLLGDFTAPHVPSDCFSVVSMMHVLEHLPSRDLGVKAVVSSMNIASGMVLFRGPLWNTGRFDGTDLGLYFSHWIGHKAKFDIGNIVTGISLSTKNMTVNMKAYAVDPIKHSDELEIIPINDKSIDTHGYTPELGPKAKIEFVPPVYKELIAIIEMQNEQGADSRMHTIKQQLEEYVETYLVKKRGAVLLGQYTPSQGMVYTESFQPTMMEK